MFLLSFMLAFDRVSIADLDTVPLFSLKLANEIMKLDQTAKNMSNKILVWVYMCHSEISSVTVEIMTLKYKSKTTQPP